MEIREFQFRRRFDDSAFLELGKMVNHFFEHVEIQRVGENRLQILKTSASTADLDDVFKVVDHFMEGHRPVAEKVLDSEAPLNCQFCGEFSDDRVMVDPGVFLQGPEWATELLELRLLIETYFAKKFAFTKLVGSALIQREVLIKAGYFKKFAHHVQPVGRPNPGYWKNIEFSRYLESNFEQLYGDQYALGPLVLNPVTCFHVYSQARELIPRHQSRLYGITGPLFRYESKNHNANRLAEFTLFELVALESREKIQETVRAFDEAFREFVRFLGLPFQVQTASDPFFGDGATLRRDAQLLNASKREIRIPMGSSDMAVASVNLHDDAFAKAFELGSLGVEATCCAGIGIERLLVALKSYGLACRNSERLRSL